MKQLRSTQSKIEKIHDTLNILVWWQISSAVPRYAVKFLSLPSKGKKEIRLFFYQKWYAKASLWDRKKKEKKKPREIRLTTTTNNN